MVARLPRLFLCAAFVAIPAACVGLPSFGWNGATHLASLIDLIRDPNAGYDTKMVETLGADERGMKTYVLAFLKRGPNRGQDATAAAELQKKHMENIFRMAEKGQLLMAGPFADDGEVRGLYLFNTSDVEEARQWTSTDPAIAAGRLSMELHPWYGPAAMLLVPDLNKRMEKPSPPTGE
jgi:uncharacterized protein